MNNCPFFIILVTSNFTTPIIETCKKAYHGSQTEHVMEVTDYIVSQNLTQITLGIGLYLSNNSTNSCPYNYPSRVVSTESLYYLKKRVPTVLSFTFFKYNALII